MPKQPGDAPDVVSIRIEAAPEAVWDEVSDLPRMGRYSPENLGGWWIKGVPRATGSWFQGLNRHGLVPWLTHARVIEAARPSVFAFDVLESRARWTYRIVAEQTEDSRPACIVTETREITKRPAWLVRVFSGSGLIGKDRDRLMVSGMQATLDAVKAALETDAPTRQSGSG